MSSQQLELDRPVVVENIQPRLDCGRFAVKREEGDVLDISADIFADGHGLLAAALKYRHCNETAWHETPMRPLDNDRWQASFPLEQLGRYLYTVEAWRDVFGSWQSDLRKRIDAGEDVSSELLDGRRLLEEAAARANLPLPAKWERLGEGSGGDQAQLFLDPELTDFVSRYADKSAATSPEPLEVIVDRERARFAAWYEMFPRSQGTRPGRSATFKEAQARLADIAAMGFDVVYLPPIHPIGRTERKGRNNTLGAQSGDPGSPWAIGDETGGHKAVQPELGTIEDFESFVGEANRLGMEIALDYAIQCSPDHPYVREHPDWFYHRPDGSIRYAENPPKKYQDIYPINFYCEDRRALWDELKSIVLFWIAHGVKIFRVDNPHTKPFPFWEWLIRDVQSQHPDVIFLAEAFTRPKVMKYLAKAGFTQSYTYFTWRNTAAELRDYLHELTQSEMAEYFRGNLFANTPDILHEVLQRGGKPAFQMRLVLAATLSPLYGIYSGFELLEGVPLHAGSEEYLDSEKFEIKVWDWDRPGNIRDYVARVNAIRRENQALHFYKNLRFQGCDNDNVLAYAKQHGENVVLAAANMDPFHPQEAGIMCPLDYVGVADGEPFRAAELLSGRTETWTSLWRHVRLDPAFNPCAIWRLSRA
ncbi:MAG TPA: alpha-1,4-glucan--maltose-1-phosphate maltosyltransferase [Chloroflexota bacterium]